MVARRVGGRDDEGEGVRGARWEDDHLERRSAADGSTVDDQARPGRNVDAPDLGAGPVRADGAVCVVRVTGVGITGVDVTGVHTACDQVTGVDGVESAEQIGHVDTRAFEWRRIDVGSGFVERSRTVLEPDRRDRDARVRIVDVHGRPERPPVGVVEDVGQGAHDTSSRPVRRRQPSGLVLDHPPAHRARTEGHQQRPAGREVHVPRGDDRIDGRPVVRPTGTQRVVVLRTVAFRSAVRIARRWWAHDDLVVAGQRRQAARRW